MRKPLAIILALILIAIGGSLPPASAQANLVTDMLHRINTARLAQGLAPYALNDALVAAAERHSKDMASTGRVDHTGSDQSSYRERILAAGYGQWAFSPIVNESVYGGTGGAEVAYEWWTSSDTYRGQILSARYREIGIAAVTGANGWTYWTLTFGAQPNVLPAFVNDGATQVDEIDVLITLTNENAVPAGEGTTTMGQALQVRLAHDDQFTGAEWQPWQVRLPFQLLPQGDPQRVYVQYRDAQGRTAVASVTVTLTQVPPTPSATLPPTATPTPLVTDTPTPSATPPPSPMPTRPPPTSASPPPGAEASTRAALMPPASLTPPPTATRTPRPRPSPHPGATPTAYAISLNDGSLPLHLTIAWAVLQAAAILLGILALVRKPRG